LLFPERGGGRKLLCVARPFDAIGGATEPVFKIKAGWVYAGGRAVLMSTAMHRMLAGAGQPFDVSTMVA
jgi:hypothetical protein